MGYYFDVIEKFENLRLPEEQHKEIFGDLVRVLEAYRQYYTNIGMKAGARIVFDLLDTK